MEMGSYVWKCLFSEEGGYLNIHVKLLPTALCSCSPLPLVRKGQKFLAKNSVTHCRHLTSIATAKGNYLFLCEHCWQILQRKLARKNTFPQCSITRYSWFTNKSRILRVQCSLQVYLLGVIQIMKIIPLRQRW